MKKKIKPKLKKIIAIVLLLIMAISIIGAITMTNLNKEEPQTVETTNIVNTEVVNTTKEIAIEETITEQTPEKEETYTTMYSTTGLNIRFGPSTDDKILKAVVINTELETVDDSEQDGWIKIKLDENYYYVARKYVSTEKTKIPITSRGETVTTYRQNSNSGVLTKSKGVNYFNGHKETWYSQRVLPGGGLKIPGRHVDGQGLVCDGDGYICVASSDYSKGTIVETSLGTGKVYDCGCASGTIDIYTDW